MYAQLLFFFSFFYFNQCHYLNPFNHKAYKRSTTSLSVKDANNLFFCSQLIDHCMKIKDFQIREDEKFTCFDQNLPIKFLTKFSNGSSVSAYGYLTQQKGSGIVSDQLKESTCETFKMFFKIIFIIFQII